MAWHCTVVAFRGGLEIASHPADGPLIVCANPDVDPDDVEDACVSQCEDRYCSYGLTTSFPFVTLCTDAECESLAPPQLNAGEECPHGSIALMQGGPARAEVSVSGNAEVDVDGESGDATASGNLRYSISECGANTCPFQIVSMKLEVPRFDLDGHDITATISNARPATGVWHADTKVWEIPAGQLRVSTNFTVDGDHGSSTLPNDMVVTGTVDPDADTFTFSGVFSKDDVTVDIVSLSGTHTNRPPNTVIGPQSPVECNIPLGASVTLDATGSTDPDNNIDSYAFYVDGVLAGYSALTPATLQLGANTVQLDLMDSQASIDNDQQVIVVEDTTAPTLMAPPDIVQEACDTAGAVVDPGQPTFSDACDSAPVLVSTIVEINGVPADIPLVSGHLFKQGVTVIRYDATDFSGHTSTVFQTVTLDFGGSCCPGGVETLLGTAGNDTLHGGNGGQCIAGLGGDDDLAGNNQADIILGGTGNDTCDGGNQSDLVRGGVGDDVVIGDNGKDGLPNGLWGGPGADTITGGNGKDWIRGGAGADAMVGGNGDDVFVIAAACEAPAGETIDGGAGHDVVVSPLSAAELASVGVVITNVEEFVQTGTLADAECVDP